MFFKIFSFLKQNDLCFTFLTNKYQIDGEQPVCLFSSSQDCEISEVMCIFIDQAMQELTPVLWPHETLRVYSKNTVWMNFVCGKAVVSLKNKPLLWVSTWVTQMVESAAVISFSYSQPQRGAFQKCWAISNNPRVNKNGRRFIRGSIGKEQL